MGYRFTRAWGAIIAGVGWVILLSMPLVAVLTVLAVQAQSPAMRTPHQSLVMALVVVMSLVVGFLVGGLCIVAGQLLRIAVHSLHLLSAMLDRLDELATRRPDERPASGRFTGLAEE